MGILQEHVCKIPLVMVKGHHSFLIRLYNEELSSHLVTPWPFLLSKFSHRFFLLSRTDKIAEGQAHHSLLRSQMKGPVRKRNSTKQLALINNKMSPYIYKL